ncbi:ArsR family transcriptional regulator [Amnibacterium kyonggiense]|uniref:ArsR family transcriptional regulator n=1 Tax=Amnibacterium kyonggiense TaxID=595671 RepID=A0A4V3EAT1_9MICO|nr:ArsR family transcriptional regulator [Amnibacterium kyonggiense]
MDEARRIGVEALKALAHPLRVRIFSELTSYGPATASSLAARLGESSGSTSYHLRQLEKHGYVREDAERGNGRDRWWERVPGPIELAEATFASDPGAREAGDLVEREFIDNENRRFADYWSSRPQLPEEWVRSTQTGSAALRLTAAELEELGQEVWAVFERWRSRPADPAAQRVDLQFRGFPIVREDGRLETKEEGSR